MAQKPNTKTVNPLDFATTMQNLEQIVAHLEKGDLPLEESLEKFAQGIQLAKQAQHTLKKAEQQVQILLEKNAKATLEDYPACNVEEETTMTKQSAVNKQEVFSPNSVEDDIPF